MIIGIIGLGRLGSLLCKAISKDFQVVAFDLNPINLKNLNPKNKNLKVASTLDDMAQADIIIPCVPISAFAPLIKQLAKILEENLKNNPKKKYLVADVCSVKGYPVKIMKKFLPRQVSILATHPMFGPDSAGDSFFARKLVLCPERISPKLYNAIKFYLLEQGLIIIETTPPHHDKEVARSLVLTHFIGRGLLKFGAKDLEIDTKGYRRLMRILSTVENDSWQLFIDMNKYNSYAKKVRLDFLKSLNLVHDSISLPLIDKNKAKSTKDLAKQRGKKAHGKKRK